LAKKLVTVSLISLSWTMGCIVCLSTGRANADTLVDLGTLGGSESRANGINDAGQVVGWADILSGHDPSFRHDHAFWYENGSMHDLGTLGGSYSEAYGINDAGQIVGESTTSSGENHGFLYENGSMYDLGTLPGGSSYAYGINNAGQIVGGATISSGDAHAVLRNQGPAEETSKANAGQGGCFISCLDLCYQWLNFKTLRQFHHRGHRGKREIFS
jgi:probable HAF family extracellular repeat protein